MSGPRPSRRLPTPPPRRTLSSLLAGALLVALAPAQRASDTLVKSDGTRLRGVEVTEFSLRCARGKRGTDAFEVPTNQVANIEWGDAPEPFLSGRASLERGDFRTAAQLFGDVKSGRPLVRVDAEFFQIKAAVGAIDNDKAAAAIAAGYARKWLRDHGEHGRLAEAMLLCSRAERLAGNPGLAAATLRELDERAAREAFGAAWSARARSELALVLLGEGKAAEARAAFQSAVAAIDGAIATPSAATAELVTLKSMARVGEGETWLADKDYGKAESFFRSLANGNQPELVAAGHAGEGEAVFLAAVAANKPDDIRRAQLSLAMASVHDAMSGEVSAKANYYLGRCLLALGRQREGDTWKQRANAYFHLVVTNYPTSRWAGPAKGELGK